MGYIICGIACFILGRKYQELMDLVMARRISKLVEQRKQLAQDQEDYEKYIEQDARIGMLWEKRKEKAE